MSDLPMIDYHVHLTGTFTIDDAVELARNREMTFGILEHPGQHSAIQTDDDLRAYIERLRRYPVHVGLQPIHLGWASDFSPELVQQVDYVLMDADTVPLDDGTYLPIWRHDLFIDDMEAFLETYMDHIVQILSTEPIQIFGRPTYLPINFARHHGEVWTRERMMQIIDLARERNIALEIQENIRLPTVEFIELAKKAGCKFTFGTNARNHSAGNLHYCLEAARQAGLTEDDFLVIA